MHARSGSQGRPDRFSLRFSVYIPQSYSMAATCRTGLVVSGTHRYDPQQVWIVTGDQPYLYVNCLSTISVCRRHSSDAAVPGRPPGGSEVGRSDDFDTNGIEFQKVWS